MFLFCLGVWGNYFGFLVPLCQFLFAPLAVHGAGSGHQSISASLPDSGDIPSNRHPLTTSTSRQEPGHKHRAHVSCENTSDESFIFMMTSQVLWNISNSLETWYSSHSRKFSSPSACQFSSAGLRSHPPWPQSPNKGALILLRLFFTGQGFLSNFNFHWLQN